MITLIFILIFCQMFGALIGTLSALWSETAYILAMRNGNINTAERAHINAIGWGLRAGMMLTLLASLGLVIISYTLHGAVQPAMTATYWIFIMFALLIIGISWALARRNVQRALGSAAAFTAWWFLLYLALGQLPATFSFGAAIALYVVFTAVVYGIFHYVRLLASPRK